MSLGALGPPRLTNIPTEEVKRRLQTIEIEGKRLEK